MDAPAFDATRFVRSALRSIAVCFSVVLISTMAMVKPAYASGTVQPQISYCLWSSFDPWARPDCGLQSADAACALVGLTANANGGCLGGYYYWTAEQSCPNLTIPNVSPCTCNDGYAPGSNGTSCVPVSACPVPELTPLPAGNACAQSLDKGLGVDVDGKCPPLSPALPGQIQCFADKIAATNVTARPPISYPGPTGKYRNAAYQAHLREIWDDMIELNKPANRNNAACQVRRNEIIAEKGCDSGKGCPEECVLGSHCIRNIPAKSSNHTQGTAFDVPQDTIKGLLDELTPLPPAPMTPLKKLQAQRFWIANWLASPATCNLVWGGIFTDPSPDFVHFQLP